MLRFHNTLTRKKEIFRPIQPSTVHLYSCGLTVYDYAHIGNLRAYIFVDLLRRWLEYRGFKVKHVMNFTDVDDKTIRGKQREGVSLREYTRKYIDAFSKDLEALNIRKPGITPRATDHISEMEELVLALLEKGYGYRGEDGSIYYNISKFKDYGKLSKMKTKELKAGARVKVDEYGKEQASDFALWKAWTPEDGDVFWETELGKGRPGWHIECSAMSMKYLGKTFDIHTGGVDNMFPHHENEIAQSEAVTGKRFANFWLHNEHLLIRGERMGKSLRNFYTLADLLSMGYDPMVVRFFLLSTHYRKQFSFSFEGLKAARNALQRLHDFIMRLDHVKDDEGDGSAYQLVEKARKRFEDAMDDDLDVGKALAAVFDLVRDANILMDHNRLGRKESESLENLMEIFDKTLGVLGSFQKKKLPKEAEELIRKRQLAREAKDWKTADAIRRKLNEMGVIVEDTPEGVKWKEQRFHG